MYALEVKSLNESPDSSSFEDGRNIPKGRQKKEKGKNVQVGSHGNGVGTRFWEDTLGGIPEYASILHCTSKTSLS